MEAFISLILTTLVFLVGTTFGLYLANDLLLSSNMAHYDQKSGELVIAKSCEKPVYAEVLK